jgi:hypothetical protein
MLAAAKKKAEAKAAELGARVTSLASCTDTPARPGVTHLHLELLLPQTKNMGSKTRPKPRPRTWIKSMDFRT